MRAVEDFLAEQNIAQIEGWIASGASKRGWISWLYGAVSQTCQSCSNVVAIAPIEPIVPDLIKELHRQWQSYGAWTFAFSDYVEANITVDFDSPAF